MRTGLSSSRGAHCARQEADRATRRERMQSEARGVDEGLSCGEPRVPAWPLPVRSASDSRGKDDAAERAASVRIVKRSAARSPSGGRCLSSLPSAHSRSSGGHQMLLLQRRSVTGGQANAGGQRSCLRHAGVLLLFLRRGTQVQHVVAPAQASEG